MNNKFTKIKEGLGLTFFCILVLLFIAIPIILFQIFISASLFSFIGMSFETTKSLINFLLLAVALSFIPEFLTDSIVQTFKDLAFLNKKRGLILDFIITVPTKVILFIITDIIIKDVKISLFAAFFVATILFILEKTFTKFLNDDEKSSNENAIFDMESSLEKFDEEDKKYDTTHDDINNNL